MQMLLTNDRDCEKIRQIKKKVLATIDERNMLESAVDKTKKRSIYWTNFSNRFQYLFGLDEKYFGELRHHTYHLDADRYEEYCFKEHEGKFRQEWDALVKNLPSKYRLSSSRILGDLGYSFDNCNVDSTTLRFQQSFRALWERGVLQRLEKLSEQKKVTIFEIGGGYGSFAYHMMWLIDNSAYFIVDIPETLLFSASYLTLNFPQKRVYLYDSSDFDLVLKNKFSEFDIVLLPNFVTSRLGGLRFDFAINVQSFQEMKPEQVDEYAKFLTSALDGELYSWNMDAQPFNKEGVNVSQQLAKFFNLHEIHWVTHARSIWSRIPDISPRKIFQRFTLKTPPYMHVREYLCVKKQ